MAFSLVKRKNFTKGKNTKDGNKYKNPRGFWEWTTYRKPNDGCVSQIKHTSTVDPHKMDMMIDKFKCPLKCFKILIVLSILISIFISLINNFKNSNDSV